MRKHYATTGGFSLEFSFIVQANRGPVEKTGGLIEMEQFFCFFFFCLISLEKR